MWILLCHSIGIPTTICLFVDASHELFHVSFGNFHPGAGHYLAMMLLRWAFPAIAEELLDHDNSGDISMHELLDNDHGSG